MMYGEFALCANGDDTLRSNSHVFDEIENIEPLPIQKAGIQEVQ